MCISLCPTDVTIRKKQWHKSDKQYLFNEFALAKVWRVRVIDAINHSPELTMPTDIPKKWVVDCRKVGFGTSAFKYLSRYLYRGVLPDKDIIKITEEMVTFKYKESSTNMTKKTDLTSAQILMVNFTTRVTKRSAAGERLWFFKR